MLLRCDGADEHEAHVLEVFTCVVGSLSRRTPIGANATIDTLLRTLHAAQ